MSFWGELKRRNVFKVGAAYLIAAWLILQVASITFPALHLPGWALTLVIVILIIGLPLALIFAWAFELTPDGVKRSEHVALEESVAHVTGRKLNYLVTGLLVVAVAYILFDNFFLDRIVIENKVASRVADLEPHTVEEEETQKTIAVLPFENLSSDPEQEFFVDGLSEELLNCLAKISGLRVTSRTSSFYFKGTKKKLQDIANDLGVEHILEGSVRKAGDKLRVTAQLIRVKDDSHLWSESYDRELKDIFDLQKDIANAVADKLIATLDIGESFQKMSGIRKIEAYEKYLVAKGLCGDVGEGNIYEISKQAVKSIDAAIELDPEFASAWALKATLHVWLNAFGPAGRSSIERDEAMHAAQKAIEFDPDLAAGYVAIGYMEESQGDFIAAEAAFRKALELETVFSVRDRMIYMSLHYITVGNFKKTHELLKEHRKSDPLEIASRGNNVINYVLLGDPQKAEEEFNRCQALFGDRWGVANHYILPVCMGIKDAVTGDDILYPNRIYKLAKSYLYSPEEALKNLRGIFDDDQSVSPAEYNYIALWAAWFGDSGFAMDALNRGLHIDASGAFWIWMPVFQEVRQLPRFKELVKEIGLVDYWNEFGWPDICRLTDNGDFECD